ncbi:hypothetical protein AWH56_022250 [Anaerobacillus isosaccharinicus]|uniref:Uncharacterized protein n=2 Tax=Anaerobacillus isosaccharinicus TaxID=1532552 RepID=A0A7S7L6R4_9BACI|nr:hypothetical protein [Anaerobacillus isosaccharinicus]MBA5586374.1 hypothetical protein [Anaerobacillus isosaccharinicus]QOY35380.1 hypothetical protein AWH56_022250 [Anaerobacillus isosaccharinicus]
MSEAKGMDINMITFDSQYKQVLTSACLKCKDPYFAPAHPVMVHVGCCSYSPVFGLFEIYQMIKAGNSEFFMESIYHHRSATIMQYEIIINAEVSPLFYEQKINHLSPIEKDDIRLQYSVCQFFKQQKGCTLPATYKNSTCRSFICLTVEEQLDDQTQAELKKWNTLIKQEVNAFVEQHRLELQRRSLNLQTNVQGVVDYLKSEVGKLA